MSRKIPWSLIALAVSLILLVILAWQNRELRRAQAELQKRAFEPYAGMWLPEIWTKTLDGVPIRIGTAPARYQVLYFFTPTCPFCRRSAPAVRALAQRLSRDPRVQMVGVADAKPDAVRRYAAEQKFRFEIASISDQRVLAQFKANSVPLLIVADAKGQVKFARAGVIEDRIPLDDALAAMGMAAGTGEPIVIDSGPQAHGGGE